MDLEHLRQLLALAKDAVRRAEPGTKAHAEARMRRIQAQITRLEAREALDFTRPILRPQD